MKIDQEFKTYVGPLVINKIKGNWPDNFVEIKFNSVEAITLNQNNYILYCEEEMAVKIALEYLKGI